MIDPVMRNQKMTGYMFGIIASVSYGLNPLFALPLYAAGIKVDSVLFYRYVFALLFLGLMMKAGKQSFALKRGEILPLAVMGLLFSFSSLFLFQAFNYMDAGIASTILFMYPVLVAVIMAVFFKERLSMVKMVSIATAFVGISMLYNGEGGATLSMAGVCFVLLSSLTYALYIVGVNRSFLKDMPGMKLTFYALAFGSLVYIVRLRGGLDLQWLSDGGQWMDALGLALFPSLISMVAIARAIHHIGPTSTAILGALEPITALFIGIAVFGERITAGNAFGILLILLAVMLIVVNPRGRMRLKTILHRKAVE